MDFLYYIAVAALLPVLVIVPGYAVLSRLGLAALPSLVFGPGLTVAAVASLSALALALPLSGAATSWIIVVVLAGATLASLVGPKKARLPSGNALPALGILLLVYVFLAGFNSAPSNPAGSITPCWPVNSPHAVAPLEPHLNSRGVLVVPSRCAAYPPSMLMMNRIPSRGGDDFLQYRTAQAVWNRHLYGPREYHFGWRLQDRTPLMGLVVAGLAAPTGVSLPLAYPPRLAARTHPLWTRERGAAVDSSITYQSSPQSFVLRGFYDPQPTDKWGYWYYRLLAMLLQTLVLLPIFYLATMFFDRRVAILAGVAAGASPAIMQNAYFTSPKYLGVYFGMAAVCLVRLERPWPAGAAIGAAYLCHPLGAILGSAVLLYQALRSWRAAGKLALAGVVVLVPWLAYSAATGGQTSLFAYPLGCFGPGITPKKCLNDFRSEPLGDIVYWRASIVPRSLRPVIASPLVPRNRTEIRTHWSKLHDFTFPGMMGLLFFPFVIWGLIKGWSRFRREILVFLGAQLAVVTVIWGLQGGLQGIAAWIAGLGVLPFLYVFGAHGLLSIGERWRRWVYAAIVIEWLLYMLVLFRPVHRVPRGQMIFAGLIALVAMAALVRLGARALRPDSPAPALGGERPAPAS